MSWSRRTPRSWLRVAVGVGVGVATTATVIYAIRDRNQTSHPRVFRDGHLPLNRVLASWTTNVEPTMKWDDNWDRKDPKLLTKPPKEGCSEEEQEKYNKKVKELTPTATRHLLFIRHGQYNTDGKKDSERYLTSVGEKQAELTGQRLKELDHPYTRLIHSNMTRARQTGEILHSHLPHLTLEVDEMLQEGGPIPPEPGIGRWKSEAEFFRDGARIEAAFRRYFQRASVSQEEDSYEIYACHANVIRYYVCRALQLPPEAWLRLSMYNGSVTWFSIRPSGRVSLRYHGDAGHMPPSLLTTN